MINFIVIKCNYLITNISHLSDKIKDIVNLMINSFIDFNNLEIYRKKYYPEQLFLCIPSTQSLFSRYFRQKLYTIILY